MIGIILLDKHNRYLVDGKLPKRPEHDKKLLATIAENLTASVNGFGLLPPSIAARQKCKAALTYENVTLGLKIPEIASSDIILVNRSDDDAEFSKNDKTFRLDDFVKLDTVEVWIRKERLK